MTMPTVTPLRRLMDKEGGRDSLRIDLASDLYNVAVDPSSP